MSNTISQRDKQVIWHPFTHLKYASEPIHIVKGNGVYLFDDKGNKYIDAFSSWWVNLHGHANAYIADKIHEQALQLEQVAFSNFTHTPAITLAERLLSHLPANQSKIFYSDNGSTSIEVALKMALQYHLNKGEPKTKIIALENGYHGDTFGGMSVAARNVFNKAFQPLLFDVVHIPVPVKGKETETLNRLEDALKNNDVCAFIFEPLVQGAGGMVMYSQSVLNSVYSLCKKHNCLTIADEVMTGFGRTGKFFATDYCEQKPDIICMSKGITGGFMPLGATSCTEEIYTAFISDNKENTFYHGHSYTANPLACAAANASMDLLEKNETQEQIKFISGFFSQMKNKLDTHPAITDCRQTGTILAIELKSNEATSYLNHLSERIAGFYLTHGIIVRPLGNVLYFLPPYCISEADLKQIETCTDEFLKTL
ncbi:MAG TPA: adenosylmethionine--8-amino-7-oxononanoate transaminase [Bacteroidia bacterium]|jgi:adenosylmethionine-8-amino-7-oxononanoate aminotransferase|nr:adenosylmethionine--8-amino-7-oxononanoate transaminase [Bacteroidia bacterium]